MIHARQVAVLALAAADAVTLVALRPAAERFLDELPVLHSWMSGLGADRAVATIAAAALWLAALWIGAGLLAAAVAHLPGTVGRQAALLSRALLPAVIRRLVAGSAGLGVVLVPVVASAHPAPPATALSTVTGRSTPPLPAPRWPSAVSVPAAPVTSTPVTSMPVTSTPVRSTPVRSTPAAPLPAPLWPRSSPARPSPPASTSPSPGRQQPTSPSPTSAPTPSTPSKQTPATPRGSTTTGGHGRALAEITRRVHTGDSLWLFAARRLGPGASTGQIAQEWPRWYAANREVIGDDPALITPGQVLHAPAPRPQEHP